MAACFKSPNIHLTPLKQHRLKKNKQTCMQKGEAWQWILSDSIQLILIGWMNWMFTKTAADQAFCAITSWTSTHYREANQIVQVPFCPCSHQLHEVNFFFFAQHWLICFFFLLVYLHEQSLCRRPCRDGLVFFLKCRRGQTIKKPK